MGYPLALPKTKAFTTNGFRLTASTGVSVPITDVAAATTIYLTPHASNEIWTYDSSVWVRHASSEISLALGTVVADTNYDVFAYWSGSALTLEKLAWSTSTAGTAGRATGLARQDGVWVKSGTASRRYVGTVRAISTTEVCDTAAKRFVFSHANRVPRTMVATDGTDSWTYSTESFRRANNSASNRLQFVLGMSEEPVDASVYHFCHSTTPGSGVASGIGINSESANSAQVHGTSTQDSAIVSQAHYVGCMANEGYHYLCWLEYGNTAGTVTWYGDSGTPTVVESGIRGLVYA